MLLAWYCLWTLTDMNETNCLKSIESNLLVLFHECLKCFPTQENRKQAMLGVLSNISEVQKTQLIQDKLFMKSITELMDNNEAAIDIVAQLLTEDSCESGLQEKLESCISTFQNIKRTIKYSSLEPVLALLTNPRTQIWSLWKLHNLMTNSDLSNNYSQTFHYTIKFNIHFR